ncbi:hypothetical protein [Microbacterium sp. NPDC096154]|uniref:hypothetical protein n=1 Tax=Microbacterium sp. NPDC096154 TaxID=3155549 RepID=UPI00331C18C8
MARETLAITAYTVGDFALALRELRTHRRITGRDDLIALIVDSERGLGRPERALEEGRAVDRGSLPTPVRVELAIAMSGARLDLGDTQLALAELDIPELDPDRAFEWSPGLFAARATVLEDLGLDDEAAQWRRRAEIAAEALGHATDENEFDVIEIDDADTEDLPTTEEDLPTQDLSTAHLPVVEEQVHDAPTADEKTEELTVEDEVAEILSEIDAEPEARPGDAADAQPDAAAEDGTPVDARGEDGEDRPDGALF